MGEKHTDEDFRAAILGKQMPTENEEKEAEDDREMCGDFRLGRCSRGDRCRFSHGTASAVSTGPSLPEEWMNKDLDTFIKDFNLDDKLRTRMVESMSKRIPTFKEDLITLRDVIRTARHPPGMLSLKLREMENGSFQT